MTPAVLQDIFKPIALKREVLFAKSGLSASSKRNVESFVKTFPEQKGSGHSGRQKNISEKGICTK